MFYGFSRDFVIAFLVYAALLGALLILLGMILALCAHRSRDRKKQS